MYVLGSKSKEKLKGVHPQLVKVVERAIQLSSVDFTVGEGLRSIERQKQLVAQGASKTMKSRHITGHAVDLYALKDGKVSWEMPLYKKIADAVLQAAKELNVDVEWGGNWETFKDGPHFQLSWKNYP